MKPCSESCIQNQEPIFQVLKKLLADNNHVLEIGSGTGQHAIYFANRMPHLIWQTSDQSQYLDGIKLWLAEAALENTPAPIELDVSSIEWPDITVDVVFSANAVHIMSWSNVVDYFERSIELLTSEGLFILYGPFNYNGEYTSQSNARFDQWLKQSNPESGVRDFEALNKLASEAGLVLKNDIEMPANNRILCWQKT